MATVAAAAAATTDDDDDAAYRQKLHLNRDAGQRNT